MTRINIMGCKVSTNSVIERYSDERLSDNDIFLSLCISHDLTYIKKVINNVDLNDHYDSYPLIYHATLYILSCPNKDKLLAIWETLMEHYDSKKELNRRYPYHIRLSMDIYESRNLYTPDFIVIAPHMINHEILFLSHNFDSCDYRYKISYNMCTLEVSCVKELLVGLILHMLKHYQDLDTTNDELDRFIDNSSLLVRNLKRYVPNHQ